MRRKVTQVAHDLASFLECGLVAVHLDATDKAVDVPGRFKSNNHLVLNLSYRFANAQMELMRDKVVATLTFGTEAYRCKIPYRAIFFLQSTVNGALAAYPENMPEELLATAQKTASKQPKLRVVTSEAGGDKPRKKAAGRPKLQLLDGGTD